jgi:hypothetical protein
MSQEMGKLERLSVLKIFQPNLLFACMDRSLTLKRATARCFNQLDTGIARINWTRVNALAYCSGISMMKKMFFYYADKGRNIENSEETIF